MEGLLHFYQYTGFYNLTWGHIIMILVGLFFLFLAITKDYEPLLLVPIGFGILIGNVPFMENVGLQIGIYEEGSVLNYIYFGVIKGVFPPLIFLGIGAMTDFSTMLSNPKLILLGAAAQIGIFVTFIVALAFEFNLNQAAAIGIIGGADGPTAIFLASRLAPELIGAIAIAAYSYMALVPLIQPPIMKLLTTKKERETVMPPSRTVSKKVKIIFPILVTVFGVLIVPPAAPLLGMLMGGNLLKESGVVDRLSNMAQNELINIITFFLGVSVGLTMTAESFLRLETIKIIFLGVFAFGFSTVGGLVIGKIMYKLSGGKINPLIGSAGVSAVPMAARVAHNVGQEANPNNYLLMHAMGPNVAGVVGTAVAAGILIAILG